MNNKPLIIANWKMNPATFEEAERLLNTINKDIIKDENIEVVICPPFIYLSSLLSIAKDNLVFGAQDCFWEDKGAYTGEISPLMLKKLGSQYVIIGHSERRKYFQETDKVINRKLKAILKARLNPVLCVGEEARDSFDSEGRSLDEVSLVIGEQVEKALIEVSPAWIRNLVIAYEPIWAIGTGNSCSSDDAMRATLFIRKILTKLYDRSIAEKVKIIYGGSVTSQNAVDFVEGANMDGVLVGRASLNASEFVKIMEVLKK